MECFFCKKNIQDIDFKNTLVIQRFVSGLGKIRSRKKTGLCAKHQRRLAKAVKRARHLGIIPISSK